MKKIYTILAIVIFFTTAFTGSKEKKFSIIGSATGFDDNTMLFLCDITDGSFKSIDSSYIMNGQFKFSGKLTAKVIKAAIRTKDFNDRCYLWLENSKINISVAKGKFRDALITGSKTQDEQLKFNQAIESSKDQREQDLLFISTHPNSIISAYTLGFYTSKLSKDSIDYFYKGLSNDVKDTYYGKNISDFITLNRNLKIGDKYADFTQQNTKGEDISLSAFNGKVILLDFWGSWCGPCRQNNPELIKTYNLFKDKGFEIFGVAAETKKSQWLEAVKADGLTWQNVTDFRGDKNRAALIYGVTYYPASFLIDQSGTIVAKDLRGEKLNEKLKELLK